MRSEARSSRSRRPPLRWVPPTCSRCRSQAPRSSPARAPCGRRTRCFPSTHAATTARSCCRRSTAPGAQSRADIARETGLTRVTISDLVAELIAEGLVIETRPARGRPPGQARHAARHRPRGLPDHRHRPLRARGLPRRGARPRRRASSHRAELARDGATGDGSARRSSTRSSTQLRRGRDDRRCSASASARPVSSTSPASCCSRPTSAGATQPLQARARRRDSALPVHRRQRRQRRGARRAQLRRRSSDMMLIKVGHGVGAGLHRSAARPLYRQPLRRRRDRPRRRRHRRRPRCACGKHGCLEAWLAAPRLDARSSPSSTATTRPSIRSRRDPARSRATARHRARARRRRSQSRRRSCSAAPPNCLMARLATRRPSRHSGTGRWPSSHGDLTLRMTALGAGHRHARRGRHGPLRTTRGLVATRIPAPAESPSGAPHPTQEKETTMKRKIAVVARSQPPPLSFSPVAAPTGDARRRRRLRRRPGHHAVADGR